MFKNPGFFLITQVTDFSRFFQDSRFFDNPIINPLNISFNKIFHKLQKNNLNHYYSYLEKS